LVIRFIKHYGQKVQAKFGLNGRHYDLRVTDPEIERHWSKMKNAERRVSEARLCVSLGENYDGFVYKLVAAVITPKTARQYPIYTIGHSNHPWGRFVELLKMHEIEAVADVRSHPYSRYCPQFNREAVCDALRNGEEGISYVYLGREFGVRRWEDEYYENDKVRYERIARSDLFRQGLAPLLKGCKTHRIALMCAEQDPLGCHRTVLVARELDRKGIAVRHILADGTLETHEETLKRKTDNKNVDFFPAEKTAAAYSVLEEKIAYTRPAGRKSQ